MKVSETAVAIAEEKRRNDEELRLCLNYLVCPRCGKNLNSGQFPSYQYECEHCRFGFTSSDKAELDRRLQYDKPD